MRPNQNPSMKIMLISCLCFLCAGIECPAQSFDKKLNWEVTRFYNEEVKLIISDTIFITNFKVKYSMTYWFVYITNFE